MTNQPERVPPHDLDAEGAVLSAILLERDAFARVAIILQAEHFYAEANRRIYEAAVELSAKGTPVDIVTVAGWLRDRERLTAVGGSAYLAQLADTVPAVAKLEVYAHTIQEKWRIRQLIATCQRVAAEGYGDVGDVEEHLAEVHRTIYELTYSRAKAWNSLTSGGDALRMMAAGWADPKPAVTTGLRALDAMLADGLRAGNVLAIAGAAKAGKSALAGQVAYDGAAEGGAVVVYASVEMPATEISARYVAREMHRRAAATGGDWGIAYADILHGKANAGQLAETAHVNDTIRARQNLAMEAVRKATASLYIQKIPPGATPAGLRDMVRRARELNPDKPAVLVIDPIQRLYAHASGQLTGRALETLNANETSRVGMVAEQIKEMADADGFAVIFTSDSTKSAAAGGGMATQGLRGSYQLNHLATTILGMTVGKDPDELAKRLAPEKGTERTTFVEAFSKSARKVLPDWWREADTGGRLDIARLGKRLCYVECSGNRAGSDAAMMLAMVRGATCFYELEGMDLDLEAASKAKDTKSAAPKGGERSRVSDGKARAAGDAEDDDFPG